LQSEGFPALLRDYNDCLLKKGQKVKLKKGNMVFETIILEATPEGQLHTKDMIDRYFSFGEVSFEFAPQD